MRPLRLALICLCMARSTVVAADDTYLTDVIAKPAYSRALTALLKESGGVPNWTRQVLKTSGDYVGAPVAYQTIGGTRYALFYTCMAHDCIANAMAVMFAPDGAQAWGAIIVEGKPISYLGAPTAAQQAALRATLQR
jgi:Inhibitor of vertebrate lysozyme (Ivy)